MLVGRAAVEEFFKNIKVTKWVNVLTRLHSLAHLKRQKLQKKREGCKGKKVRFQESRLSNVVFTGAGQLANGNAVTFYS